MHFTTNDPTDDDTGLITAEQIKLFVDRMISNSQFNDEYVSATTDWEKNNSVDRYLLQLELEAKKSRASLVKKDISSVLHEVKELSEQLNFHLEPGSKNELLVGRALLRAQADYFDEYVRRERKERSLPDSNSELLSVEELQARVRVARQQELHPDQILSAQASPADPINAAQDVPKKAKNSTLGVQIKPKFKFDWKQIETFVFQQLDMNGYYKDYPVDGWRSAADLKRIVLQYLNPHDQDPADSHLRKNLGKIVRKWLRKNPKHQRLRSNNSDPKAGPSAAPPENN